MGSTKKNEADEVEELLRQTQDDILLKLTINSHTTSSRSIDPDLDRRFNALKSRNTIKTPAVDPTHKTTAPAPPGFSTCSSNDVKSIDNDDDLFARFSKLKNSKNKGTGTSTSQGSFVEKQLKLTEFDDGDNDDDDDDEVEKLIKWATDAARLDPSPPSDDDNEDDDDEYSDSDDEDDENDNGKKCKKK